ncbi:uncharacterized protein LOC141701971 [Apium graveolens]|uniref:uncharacterized protein LOC141701971 n=1 Tax=Apium graveolens TaxID=4045 RepID=UPI003D79E848
MSSFLLPESMCKKMEVMMNKYWWQSGSTDRKGINGLLGAAKVNPGSSFIWQGIITAKNEVMQGYSWILGDGESINCIQDPWLAGTDGFKVDQSRAYVDITIVVARLLQHNAKEWNRSKVIDMFSRDDAALILSTRIPALPAVDRFAWSKSRDGKYSVKTGFQMWHSRNIGTGYVTQSNGWSKECVFLSVVFSMFSSLAPLHRLVGSMRSALGDWFFRNKVCENKIVTAAVAMEWSAKTVSDWREAKNKRANQVANSSSTTISVPVEWQKPDSGLKLNVDAAIQLRADSFSMGLLLRFHEGGLVAGKTVLE